MKDAAIESVSHDVSPESCLPYPRGRARAVARLSTRRSGWKPPTHGPYCHRGAVCKNATAPLASGAQRNLTLKKMLELLESDAMPRASGRGRKRSLGLLDDPIDSERNTTLPTVHFNGTPLGGLALVLFVVVEART